MKGRNYAKVGNKNGRPSYRTQATFRLRAIYGVQKIKVKNKFQTPSTKF
ncbi:MAG: hypothetical protein PHT40_02770 [Patescibacteria group bacterium]|nr:hypothetical protein [Patescibacteria group bacterium]